MPAIKFLGVFFDPDLNLKFHISTLKIKLSKALLRTQNSQKYIKY